MVCLCVLWVRAGLLRAEAVSRLHLKLENDYVVMLCRRTVQLKGLAYANSPNALTGAQLFCWRTAVGS